MKAIHVQLTEENSQRADELARETGRSPEELVNDAFARFAAEAAQNEQQKFQEWKAAVLQVAGIWKDRDDLPDFNELRPMLSDLLVPYSKA